MRKVIFGVLALMLVVSGLQAQDLKKETKKAKKNLNAFNLDQSKKDELMEAKISIDAISESTVQAADARDVSDYWLLKGDIYNNIATQLVALTQLGTPLGELETTMNDNNAFIAYEAYMNAYESADKGSQERDALKGLQNLQANLSNAGIMKYESGDYSAAFQNFEANLKIHDFLKEKGEDSALDVEESLNEQRYIAGLAAMNAQDMASAKTYLQPLYEAGTDRALVYEAMYSITANEEGPDAAYEYLEAGRKKFPEEVSLLFAEINHFLKKGELDVLIGKLEEGIKAEPENTSLYNVTGNVYDQLYQKEIEAGNEEKAEGYFNKAKSYWEQAIKIDSDNVDAVYSIGALYYNKAAALTQQMNVLADDYSKEGLKKYEEMKEQVFTEFEKALPYFQKAEALDPNDVNTLIALKEIYAKKDDLETSNIFKERLENAQSGGTNNSSYFN